MLHQILDQWFIFMITINVRFNLLHTPKFYIYFPHFLKESLVYFTLGYIYIYIYMLIILFSKEINTGISNLKKDILTQILYTLSRK